MTVRPDPRLGTDLGPYHLEAVIGRGGMGTVYRATDKRLDRRVALKLLAPQLADDEAFRQRFIRESRLAASIDHPNIIPVYEAGESDGAFFIAMRYVEGVDLETRIAAGALTSAETVHLLEQVARALDAAHDEGLVHRDVKPANILIASGKGADATRSRLSHGLRTDEAPGLGDRRHTCRTFLGTLDYIAPEQIEGDHQTAEPTNTALACVAYRVPYGTSSLPTRQRRRDHPRASSRSGAVRTRTPAGPASRC